MPKFDRKTLMMDAGTAVFTCEKGFGSAIGKVKAAMAHYGKVLTANHLEAEALPSSCRGCDLLLERSTPWRTRYISCKVSSCGEGYAAEFKEGSRSGLLRSVTFAALILCLTVLTFLPSSLFPGALAAAGALRRITCIALALLAAWLWMVPSLSGVKTVKAIAKSLSAA